MAQKPAIRDAGLADVPAMVRLLSAYREKLSVWSPNFWRPSASARIVTSAFLAAQTAKRGVIALVSDTGAGVNGFAIAAPAKVPPVFAPGGPTGLLDDFAIADSNGWDTIGRALIYELINRARTAEWSQLIATSPTADRDKNALLESVGLAPTSQWWVRQL